MGLGFGSGLGVWEWGCESSEWRGRVRRQLFGSEAPENGLGLELDGEALANCALHSLGQAGDVFGAGAFVGYER